MATIKDVAQRAKVSTATVSYVLNGTGTVTDETRRRVMEAVADLNYQPNHAARSLRSRSRTMGIVLPALSDRLTDPTLAEVLAGISEGAAARGYYLLLATAGEEQPEQALGELLARSGRVDGLALFDVRVEDERAAFFATQGVPFVCAGLPPAGVVCPFVAADVRGGAARAVQHLAGLGHRRIALIVLPSDLTASEPTSEGFTEALAGAGLPADPSLVIEAGVGEDDGLAAMQELLALPEPPSAVVAASDALALGAMHALRDAGYEIGHDVSVVGFDDLPGAAHAHPPLTALRAPRRSMGAAMARLLADRIEGRLAAQPAVELEMQLIIRRSSGPPRAAAGQAIPSFTV